MTSNVTDKYSNFNDNLAHAAKVLNSKHRRDVFKAIYRGKKAVKTQDELQKATALSAIRILQETGTLFANDMVGRQKVEGRYVFAKIRFYAQHKNAVVRLAENKKKLAALPTKTNPGGRARGKTVTIKVPSKSFTVSDITVDDIDSFSKVNRIAHGQAMRPIAEQQFKQGVKNVIGQGGKFTDWGGEKNDLFTTNVRLNGKRLPSAFAFKGKGKKGILKPKDFGKNGDQIHRLFQSDARLFMLQYWNQLDQSVYEQMRSFAIAKSAMTGEKIYFGIIEGDDTQRLKAAYPKQFR
ncbi:MAG TPA: hypothetical protein VNP98_06410 [Chthoniobacterales bacterium]|nr:hypothetical protein [Chthoniobacterales bacterium]